MPRVAYQVTIEVDPDVEQAWNEWHSAEHVRDILLMPGFLGATKYRDESPAFDGWVRYVCRFELESREALTGYLASSAPLREEHQRRYGETTRVSRQILVEVGTYEVQAVTT